MRQKRPRARSARARSAGGTARTRLGNSRSSAIFTGVTQLAHCHVERSYTPSVIVHCYVMRERNFVQHDEAIFVFLATPNSIVWSIVSACPAGVLRTVEHKTQNTQLALYTFRCRASRKPTSWLKSSGEWLKREDTRRMIA